MTDTDKDKETRKKIGEILRLIRQAFKLTQDEAAKKANISRSTLIAIEKGDSTNNSSILAMIAWFLLNANPVIKLLIETFDLTALVNKLNKK